MIPTIKIQLNASDINATKQEFQALLNDLQRMSNGNPIKIDLNTVTTQITQMAEQLKNVTSQTFNINTSVINENINKTSETVKTQVGNIKKELESLNNTKVNKIDFSSITENTDNSFSSIEKVKEALTQLGGQGTKVQIISNDINNATQSMEKFTAVVKEANGVTSKLQFGKTVQTDNLTGGTVYSDYKYLGTNNISDNSIAKQQQEQTKANNQAIQEQNTLYKESESILNEIYQTQLKINKDANSYASQGLQEKLNGLNKELEANFKLLDVEKQNQLLASRKDVDMNLNIGNLNSIDKLKADLDYLSNKFKGVFPASDIEKWNNDLNQMAQNSNLSGQDIAQMDEKLKVLKTDLIEASRIQGLGIKVEDSGLNINSSTKEIEDYVKEMYGAKASVTNFGDVIEKNGQKFRSFNIEINEGNNRIKKLTDTIDQSSESTYSASKGVQDLSNRTVQFGDKIRQAFEAVAGFSIVSGAVFGMVAQIKDAITYTNELNKSMTNIQMITSLTSDKTKELVEEYRNAAKQMGQNDQDFLKGSENMLRAGLDENETKSMLKSTAVGSAVSGVDNTQMSDYLITLRDAFGLTTKQIGEAVDKISVLDTKSSTSFAGIIEGMKRSAASANQVGIAYDKLASMITTVESVSHKSASTVGENFKTIFSRMENVKAGMKDENDIGINDVEKVLSKDNINIKLRESAGEWRNMGVVIDDISKKWNNFDSVTQSQIASVVAGKQQMSTFLTLMQNYGKEQQFEKDALNSQGSAWEKYQVYLNSTESKLNTLKTTTHQLFSDMVDSSTINTVVTGLGKIISTIDLMISSDNKAGIALIVLSTAFAKVAWSMKELGVEKVKEQFEDFFAKSISSVQMFSTTLKMEGAMGALSSIKSGLQGVANVAGTMMLSLATNPLTWIGVAIAGLVAFESHQQKVLDNVKQSVQSYKELKDAIASADTASLKQKVDELQQKEVEGATLKGKLMKADIEASSGNPIDKIMQAKAQIEYNDWVTGIEKGGYHLDEATGKIKELKTAQDELAKDKSLEVASRELQDSLGGANNTTAQLIQTYQRYVGITDKSPAEQKKMAETVNQLQKIYGDLTVEVDKNGNTLIKNTDVLEQHAGALATDSSATNNAIGKQENYKDTLQTSIDSIKDYSKYIKEMNDNSGHLKAGSALDLVKGHPELIKYLGDEKTLYDKLQEAVKNETDTAQTAYLNTVKDQVIAEKSKKAELLDSINTYQKLSGQVSKNTGDEKANAQAKAQMSDIASQLAGQIDGLIVVKDKDGNATIQNTGLLDKQIQMLGNEGSAIDTLKSIKLAATKDMASFEVDNTTVTYKEVSARIGFYENEIKVIQAQQTAFNNFVTQANQTSNLLGLPIDPQLSKLQDYTKNYNQGQIDKAQSSIDAINKAKNEIDNLYKSGDSSKVIKDLASTSEGDYANTKAEKAKKDAEKAQKEAQQAQEKALEGKIKKLDDEKKAYDTSVENAYKAEQQQEDAIIKGYETQLNALKEKKQLQDDTNKELEYQNQLIKDQQALQNAQNEKNVRIFENGKWQWEADQSKVQQAQDALTKSQKDYSQWQSDQAEKKAEDELNDKIKQAQDRKSAYATDYQNKKDATDQNYDAQKDALTNQKETLQGYYAEGTDYVPKTGKYLVGEKGAEVITLPEGASVTPNNKIGQELNPVTNVATNPIVQSTKKTLDEVDDVVQKFVDDSPQYSKEMDRKVGIATLEHKDLVKKPLDRLIDEIIFEIQRFVNASGQYGENTDKNIGSGIANSSETVMNPTRALITNVKELLNNFAISTIEYGKLMDTQLGQGIIDGTPDLLDKTVKDLTQKVIDKFKEGFGIHSPSTVMHEIGGFLMQGLINGMNESDITKFISEKVGSVTGGVTGAITGQVANVPGNVQDWIRQAMLATGVPDSWFNSLVSIAMHESGGDPNSINTYDSNAIAGHPSQGLMQTIPETFASNMLPGHNNILNPVDNAIAAIRYIIGRYGDVSNVPGIKAMARGGSYVGYQTGTESVPDTGLAMVGEQGAELRVLNQGDGIITSKRTRILNQIADMPNILSKLSSDSLLSKLSVPNNLFNLKTPDVNVIIPKSNMGGESGVHNHINIENIELPNAVDGESFVNSLTQLLHVTNNN